MPVRALKSSAARCCVEPTAIVPSVSWPGWALPNATSSRSDLKRASLRTAMTSSKTPSVLTGAKSLCTSNGSFLNRPALTALAFLISSSV